ncbi:MAG: sugar phosphate isomerase/epimerase [Armatimonadetes bacterium]|nr:sugar phosphate isomerase/epimerase [Armatimonadota bacterium]
MRRLPFGLCAYGIVYTLGHAGRGTPLANPQPINLFELLELAAGLGLSTVELPPHLLLEAGGSLADLRAAAESLDLRLVVAGRRLSAETMREELDWAATLGAKVVRCTLSGILGGDRREVGLAGWEAVLDQAARTLAQVAPRAAERGLRVGVENHQDATSHDLVALCERVGSATIGITLDTGNPLAVAEEPLAFARRVAPYLVDVHLKDYRIFPSAVGFRLVHCAIGAGVVPFEELWRLIEPLGVPCSIEMAALEARHVRLLEDDWWAGYPPREARELAAIWRLVLQRGEQGEWRTPFERGETEGLAAWEMVRLRESVANLAALREGVGA